MSILTRVKSVGLQLKESLYPDSYLSELSEVLKQTGAYRIGKDLPIIKPEIDPNYPHIGPYLPIFNGQITPPQITPHDRTIKGDDEVGLLPANLRISRIDYEKADESILHAFTLDTNNGTHISYFDKKSAEEGFLKNGSLKEANNHRDIRKEALLYLGGEELSPIIDKIMQGNGIVTHKKTKRTTEVNPIIISIFEQICSNIGTQAGYSNSLNIYHRRMQFDKDQTKKEQSIVTWLPIVKYGELAALSFDGKKSEIIFPGDTTYLPIITKDLPPH